MSAASQLGEFEEKGRRSAAPANCFHATQGSQSLALGLTMSAASQLVEFEEK